MAEQSVDFLPASYHEEQVRVKRSIWRKCTLVVVLAMIVLGTFRHRDVQKELQEQSRRAQENAKNMAAELMNPAELRQQIHVLQVRANLMSYLRIGVPPTLLVSSVTNNLPAYISLTKIESTYESDTASQSRANKRKRDGKESSKNRLAEEKDLEQLSEETKNSDVFVTVRGIAPDDVAISQYLAALNKTNVFNEVKLKSIDKDRYSGFPMRRFEIRLRVKKPGASSRSATSKINNQEQTPTSLNAAIRTVHRNY